MKTFEEIVDTILKQEGYVTFDQFKYIWDGETLMSYLTEAAKIYAESALDAAAEIADFREITPEEEREGDTNTICNDHGIGYCVNKEAILSLKDQLK